MSQNIELFFDISSPFSYLAWHRLNQLTQAHDATIELKPVQLSTVFELTGNSSPARVSAKLNYLKKDLDRYATRYRVNLRINPHAPIDTTLLMQGAVVAIEEGVGHRYVDAMFNAMWSSGKDLRTVEVLKQVLSDAEIDPSIIDRAQSQKYAKQLQEDTDLAVKRGIFGTPTMIANGDMLFGQDRLWVIEELLGARSPF